MPVFISGAKHKLTPGFMVIASPRFRNAECNTVGIYLIILFSVAIIGFYKMSFADKSFGKNVHVPMLTDNRAIPVIASVAKLFLHAVFRRINTVERSVVHSIKIFIQK